MKPTKERTRTANNVLAMVTLSHITQHVFVGTSILFPIIITELNMNYSQFGIVIATSAVIASFFRIFFGIASRKISRYILLGLGNILLSTGTFLTGTSQNMINFLNARLIANVGVAPQHSMATAILAEKFDSKRVSGAIGIHYGLGYIGNIIGPLLVTFLLVAFSWRNILFFLSIPTLILGLTTIWYLRGDKKLTQSNKTAKIPTLKSDLRELLKTRSVKPIIISQALLSGGAEMGIITIYTPLFLSDALKLDVNGYIYGITFTIGLVGGILGPILLSRYSEKSDGHLKVAAAVSLISPILIYLLSFYDSANLLLVFHLFFLGFSSFSLPTLLQSHLVKITQKYKIDLVVSILFTVTMGFSALWTGLTGFIIDTYSSFTPAFILIGTLGLIAFSILMRETRMEK